MIGERETVQYWPGFLLSVGVLWSSICIYLYKRESRPRLLHTTFWVYYGQPGIDVFRPELGRCEEEEEEKPACIAYNYLIGLVDVDEKADLYIIK